jgi:hypothetical protein
MASIETRHLTVAVDAPADAVYAVASDPRTLPRWAAGLAGATVEPDGDHWATDSPMGRVRFRFVPDNDLGVLDHVVDLPDGTSVYNPLRVLPDGDGCEVVFTLRRPEGMGAEDYERDAAAVERDLTTLKRLVEDGAGA